MWHACVAFKTMTSGFMQLRDARRLAKKALAGAGDTKLGQWVEMGDSAAHCERRLSVAEQASIGRSPLPVDIRNTPEFDERVEVIKQWCPQAMLDALGGIH